MKEKKTTSTTYTNTNEIGDPLGFFLSLSLYNNTNAEK